jgi:hypothetical protein
MYKLCYEFTLHSYGTPLRESNNNEFIIFIYNSPSLFLTRNNHFKIYSYAIYSSFYTALFFVALVIKKKIIDFKKIKFLFTFR